MYVHTHTNINSQSFINSDVWSNFYLDKAVILEKGKTNKVIKLIKNTIVVWSETPIH